MKKCKACPRKKICQDECYGENPCDFALTYDKLTHKINAMDNNIQVQRADLTKRPQMFKIGDRVRVDVSAVIESGSLDTDSVLSWFVHNGDHGTVFTVTDYKPVFSDGPYILDGVLCDTSLAENELILVTEDLTAYTINIEKLNELDSHWTEITKLAEKYGFILQAYSGTAVLATHKNQLEQFGAGKYLDRQKEMFRNDMTGTAQEP